MKKEERKRKMSPVKNKHVHIIILVLVPGRNLFLYIFYYSRIIRYYHIQCMYDTCNSHSLARVCVCVCVKVFSAPLF